MRKRTQFTIVGGGLTATAMLCQLVEILGQRAAAGRLDPRGAELSILEKKDFFGPGFPHNPRNLMPFHITNMCAADMGIFFDRKSDFQVWINANLDLLRARFPHYPAHYFRPALPPKGCRHYPRAFMGEYLRTRFQEAIQTARKLKLIVNLYPRHEVIRIQPAPGAMAISARCLSTGKPLALTSHALLLATGHWFTQRRQENYLDSPWPAAALLDAIPPGVSVGVLGSSLSAIETALTLTSDGHFTEDAQGNLSYRMPANPRTLTLFSRRGLLPRVRGPRGPYHNRWLTLEEFRRLIQRSIGGLSLASTMGLLAKELAAAYGRPVDWSEVAPLYGDPAESLVRDLTAVQKGDASRQGVIWQSVLAQTFPFIREWYLALKPEERRRFDHHYTSVFFCHAATQPAINARKMLALIQAGVLRVVPLGADYRIYRPQGRGEYRFQYMDPRGQERTVSHDFVVDARGQPQSLSSDPSPLARNLVAVGIAASAQPVNLAAGPSIPEPSAGEGIRINPRSHRVRVSPHRWPHTPELYAVGAMTRNQIIDASMAQGICRSTATIARHWADILAGQDAGQTES
ncbi:MAG: FAD/NAD(P)-binding protein [Desulfobacterales bacterium]